MSTLGYAALTNQRFSDQPNAGTNSPTTGVKTYVDALSAMVPAEVLAAHSVVINFLYSKDDKPALGNHFEWQFMLLFAALALLSILLFVVPRKLSGLPWVRGDLLRALIPPVAFVGWSVLQPVSLLDGWCKNIDRPIGSSLVIVVAVVLGMLTTSLASAAAGATAEPNV